MHPALRFKYTAQLCATWAEAAIPKTWDFVPIVICLVAMAATRERRRCRAKLERLSGSSLDRDSVRLEAIAELQRVIGFDRWCWPLADPDTLVASSGLAAHELGPKIARFLELEYSEDAFAAKPLLARRANPAGSLRVETGGDLARSTRWDEVMRPAGIGDIAVVACRDALGCWGWVEAYRDRADRSFDEDELALLASVGSGLGSALRRTIMQASNGSPPPGPPGVIVLDRQLGLVSWSASAHAWLDVLPGAKIAAAVGMLPTAVYPVATLARCLPDAGAHALLWTVDGRWVTVEATVLEGRGGGEITVTLRSAAARETLGLLCRTYALTPRERELVAALIAGLDTRGLAERLSISRHTVQDHFKAIFGKVGVHSRRALLTKLGMSVGS